MTFGLISVHDHTSVTLTLRWYDTAAASAAAYTVVGPVGLTTEPFERPRTAVWPKHRTCSFKALAILTQVRVTDAINTVILKETLQ